MISKSMAMLCIHFLFLVPMAGAGSFDLSIINNYTETVEQNKVDGAFIQSEIITGPENDKEEIKWQKLEII